VWQVDPVTLARVRSIAFPRLPPRFAGASPVITAGPAGSVWIGSDRGLLRVASDTGEHLAGATLPPGTLVSDIAADPAGADLYVSAARQVRGGMGGAVILEYGARSGHPLAMRSGGLISDSVAGAWPTAVLGGVW